MEKRRPITEDDLLLTELLIARSFGNLKHSVMQSSLKALGSVGGTIKRHPYATAGAAAGAGILLFGLLSLLIRGGSGRRRSDADQERTTRPDLKMEILSMLMPVVMPYITTNLQKFLGRTFPRDRD